MSERPYPELRSGDRVFVPGGSGCRDEWATFDHWLPLRDAAELTMDDGGWARLTTHLFRPLSAIERLGDLVRPTPARGKLTA